MAGGFVERFGVLDEFAAEEPFAKTALAPFGEILGGDLGVLELGGEDLFGFGEVVEPGKDGAGGFVVFEAAVEGVASGEGETGDLAAAGGGGGGIKEVHKSRRLEVEWRTVMRPGAALGRTAKTYHNPI